MWKRVQIYQISYFFYNVSFTVHVISVIMEDLRGYTIMRKCLVTGNFDLSWATAIAHSAATIHRKTNRKCLAENNFRELVRDFR